MIDLMLSYPLALQISFVLLQIVFAVFFAWTLVESPNQLGSTDMPNFLNVMVGLLCGALFPLAVPCYLLTKLCKRIADILVRLKYGE